MQRCYKCGTVYGDPDKPGFQALCEKCESYLHCCMNCRFYDESAHNQCREPQAEFQSDTHGFNRCEYFQFKMSRRSMVEDPEDPEIRRKRRRPDWRNLQGRDDGLRSGGRRPRARNPFGDDNAAPRPRAKNPFGNDVSSSRPRAKNPFGDDAPTSRPRPKNPFGDDDQTGRRSRPKNPFGDDDKSRSRPKNPFAATPRKAKKDPRKALDDLFKKDE